MRQATMPTAFQKSGSSRAALLRSGRAGDAPCPPGCTLSQLNPSPRQPGRGPYLLAFFRAGGVPARLLSRWVRPCRRAARRRRRDRQDRRSIGPRGRGGGGDRRRPQGAGRWREFRYLRSFNSSGGLDKLLALEHFPNLFELGLMFPWGKRIWPSPAILENSSQVSSSRMMALLNPSRPPGTGQPHARRSGAH